MRSFEKVWKPGSGRPFGPDAGFPGINNVEVLSSREVPAVTDGLAFFEAGVDVAWADIETGRLYARNAGTAQRTIALDGGLAEVGVDGFQIQRGGVGNPSVGWGFDLEAAFGRTNFNSLEISITADVYRNNDFSQQFNYGAYLQNVATLSSWTTGTTVFSGFLGNVTPPFDAYGTWTRTDTYATPITAKWLTQFITHENAFFSRDIRVTVNVT